METKYMPMYRVVRNLNLKEWEEKRIFAILRKRHRADMWVLYRHDATMVKRAYLFLEGVEWIKEVYLRKDIYYVDAEVDFTIKQIKRLENELQKRKDYFVFTEMNVHQLCEFFDKKERSIRDGIKKLVSVLPDEKVKRYGKVYITATGVKWLEENVYRQRYWQDLLEYKRFLQGVKRREEKWQDQN